MQRAAKGQFEIQRDWPVWTAASVNSAAPPNNHRRDCEQMLRQQ